MTARNIIEVIDRVVAIMPELQQPLARIRSSAGFAAPEWQDRHWQNAAAILADAILAEHCPKGHPKHEELVAIWNEPPPLIPIAPPFLFASSPPEPVVEPQSLLSERWAFEFVDFGGHVQVTVRVGTPGSRALAGRLQLRIDEAEELRAALGLGDT